MTHYMRQTRINGSPYEKALSQFVETLRDMRAAGAGR